MKRAILALGLLVAGLAAAQEPAAVRLPLNPFAKAKEKDWSACIAVVRSTTGGVTVEAKVGFVHAISMVGEKAVEVVSRLTIPDLERRRFAKADFRATYSLGEAPTLVSFLNMTQLPTTNRLTRVEDVRVDDDKRKAGGREFACRRVRFVLREGTATDEYAIWFCDEVKGWGVVALTRHAKGKDTEETMDLELAGYGSGPDTLWGKTLDQVAQELKPKPR